MKKKSRLRKANRKKAGSAPGTVLYTGDQSVDEVFVHHLQYNSGMLNEQDFNSKGVTFLAPSDDNIVDWYDTRGMQDAALINKIADTYKVHPLVRENAVDVNQRPTYEEYDRGNFIIAKSLNFNDEKLELEKEHIAIYFRKGLLLTFQETESDVFESVRRRLQLSTGRIRERGSDYLAYALLDVLADNYYHVLDAIEVHLEELEEGITIDAESHHRNTIHHLKKEVLQLRKSVVPLREAANAFSKTDNILVEDSTQLFVRNLYDQTVHIVESIESYRDMLNSLQDLFLSEVSFKMNKVMQLLTLISVIFIPLTFLAGIYGMNFEYIPELKAHNGYFILLGVMAVTAMILLWLFKRKKWL